LNVGGPARHVASLMTGLDPARFAQTLVAGRVQAGEDDLGPQLRAQGIEYRELAGLGRALNPVRDLASLGAVFRLLMRLRPEIVDTHTAKAGTIGRAALLLYRPLARLTGRPVPRAIHTFHGHTFHGYFSPLATRLFLAIERFLAKHATWRIVAISPRQFREICQAYGVGRPEQYAVLPLGIDLAPFADPAAERAGFRRELGVGESEFPVKNYGLFLETAARLKDRRPELYARARFALVGGGDLADLAALRDQAATLGVAERVVFCGNRSDPGRFMAGLDALVMTSLNEGTPMAILEAGACGAAVAATAVGGIPDLLGESKSTTPEGYDLRPRGLTAPSGDAGALAAALARLMDEPDLARRLGQSLKQMVWSGYDQARLIADTARLYRQAAGRE
jgi:glycosyltransferase involved in cell wall biosynthesis